MSRTRTQVRRYDESTVVVPNGVIVATPVTNLSRMAWGQYKTDIRLRYEDLPLAERVVADVKAELAAMPDVINCVDLKRIFNDTSM